VLSTIKRLFGLIVVIAILAAQQGHAAPIEIISVTLNKIRVVGDVNPDGANGADFFTRISIDGTTFDNEDVGDQDDFEGNNEIAPNWEFSRRVDIGSSPMVSINIAIMDEDELLRGGSNILDASSNVNTNSLSITLDTSSCVISLITSGTFTNGSTNANCGEMVKTVGDGAPSDQGSVELTFQIKAELSPGAIEPLAGSDPFVRCLHSPLLPDVSEQIYINADPKLADKDFNFDLFDIQIWFASSLSVTDPPIMAAATPATECSASLSCTHSATMPVGTQSFAYGCVAKINDTSVWSGWKTVPVNLRGSNDPVPVIRTGPSANSVDLVYIADENSLEYDSPFDRDFHTDIHALLKNGLYARDTLLARQDQVNVWIATEKGKASDADVSRCNHELPDSWDEDYAFSDAGLIVHTWEDSGGVSFRDCGPRGGSHVSVPNSNWNVMLHELGHTPFGLADEYPRANYFEPNPHPNIYRECGAERTEDCENDLSNLDRANGCRFLERENSGSGLSGGGGVSFDACEYTTSEPRHDDLMLNNGKIQAADRRRIHFIFDECEMKRC